MPPKATRNKSLKHDGEKIDKEGPMEITGSSALPSTNNKKEEDNN